jgi:glutamine amidotransferase
MITVIDYGIGNLGSICNMLKKIGAETVVASDPLAVSRASKLILPGVGAFDAGMQRLAESGLIPALQTAAIERQVPLLGICLGMQLLTRRSEEGVCNGLGFIDAETVRFRAEEIEGRKIPHMGWSEVRENKKGALTNGIQQDERYYFVHSYYVKCVNRGDVLLTAEYGHEFDAAFLHKNIMGVQFHPEKSHKFGMRLFRNFVEGC